MTAGTVAAAPGETVAAGLAAVLSEVLHVPAVRADAHFFEDLGADSMVMAQFCARVRKRPDLPAVSIKDVYRHPTIGDLAAAVAPLPDTNGLEGDFADSSPRWSTRRRSRPTPTSSTTSAPTRW